MKVGLAGELLSLEWIPQLKACLERMHPKIEWVHTPLEEVSEQLILDGDACYPFKKMVRTSLALMSGVDVLIVPRIISLDGFLMCPNFRALPDMVRLNSERRFRDEVPPIVSPVLEISGGKQLEQAAVEISAGISGWPEPGPETPVPVEKPRARRQHADIRQAIALIGHPYVLADPRLNNHVPDILCMNGVDVVTAQEIPFNRLTELAEEHDYYAKKLYWRSAREALGAFLYFSRVRRPAGIIHLVPFNCGVDALLRIELMSLHKQMDNAPPYMVIVCDEHTQRDHVVTRLEAFLDIIHGIRIN